MLDVKPTARQFSSTLTFLLSRVLTFEPHGHYFRTFHGIRIEILAFTSLNKAMDAVESDRGEVGFPDFKEHLSNTETPANIDEPVEKGRAGSLSSKSLAHTQIVYLSMT